MKRRIMALTLALCMALSLLPMEVLASDGDFEIVDGTLVRYNGPGGDVTIPTGVTVIGDGAFEFCPSLTSVIMPEGVIEIGSDAFKNCYNLRNVQLPSTLSEIGDCAFWSCSSLYSVNLGGVKSIKCNAFYDCRNLSVITAESHLEPWEEGLPSEWDSVGTADFSNVEMVEDGAFSGCSNLRRVWLGSRMRELDPGAFSDDGGGGMGSALEVFAVSSGNYSYKAKDGGVLYNYGEDTLIKYPPKKAGTSYTVPDTVKTIAEGAFKGASALMSVTLPGSVKTIESNAFEKSGLTGVTIPTGVTQIESYTFAGCGSLVNVTIPNTVTEIESNAFADCAALSAVTIPDSVKNIGYEAFIKCGALTTLTIPDHVERIGGNAFYNCDNLETVTIGSGVKYIETRAFYGCAKLTAFTVAEANTAYQDIEGVLYNKLTVGGTQTADALIQYPSSRAGTEYTVLDSVKSIKDNAFGNAAKLTKITLPKGLEKIRYGAFEGCTALPSITIPDSVNAIEFGVFAKCNALTEVKILTTNAVIGDSAFWNCPADCKFQVYADSTAEALCIKKNYTHTIMPRVTMAESMVSFPAGFQAVYNQAAQTPEIIVKDGEKTLTKGTDYTVAYENNIDAGQEAKVTVTGKRNYSGSATKNFTITPAAVTETMFTVDLKDEGYTGAEITKMVAGKDGEKSLAEGTDYTVAYESNTNAGEAKLTVTGKGNYQGTVEKSFNITPVTLTEAMFTVDTASEVYTGDPITKTVFGTNGDVSLKADSDYTVTYENNTDKGSAAVKITGKGNYDGTVTKNFTITPATITEAMFTVNLDSEVYTGAAIEKTVSGNYNGKTMVKEADYTVEYDNNVDVGTATITITGQGNYTGELTKTFAITKAGLGSLTITLTPGDTVYTGGAITQTVTVKQGAVTLAEGTDYTVSYENNKNAGTATVTVTGKGNYSGTATKSFQITQMPLTEGMFTVDTPSVVYTGAAINGTVTGANGSTSLILGADYTVACTDNVNAGKATITVTGTGNYGGTVTKHFTITQKPLTDGMFTVDTPSVVYTGAAINGTVTGVDGSTPLLLGTDYTVSCTDNVNVGTATVTVTGKGNYSGTVTGNFTITQAAITEAMFTVDTDPAAYTGAAIEKTVSGSYNGKPMVKETDYTVEYQDNTNVGTAKLTIKGKGNFSGELKKQFSIMAEALEESMFTVDTDPEVYTGDPITKTVTGSAHGKALTEGTDYKVRYESNTDAGTAKILISGDGDYGGTVTRTFTITPAALSDVTLEVNEADETYTGEPITKPVTGSYKGKTLTADTDYTVACTDNVDVGTATVTITGKGNYSGTVTGNFTITQATITEAMFTVDTGNETFTGAAIEKTVSGNYNGKTMAQGTDYTVSYANNTDIGAATLTITGIGNYQGTLTKSFRITAGAIKADMFTVDLSDGVYTGSAITRTVTGKDGEKALTEGTDYSVTYSDNVNAGTAKIFLQGMGDYGGMVTKTFTILPAPLTELTPTLEGTAKVGQTLSAKVEGVDDKELTWTWTVGGTAVAGQTGSTYTVQSGDGEKTVTVKATAVENGNYTGSTKDSASLTIEKKSGSSGGSGGYWGSVGSSSDSAKGKEIQVSLGDKAATVTATVTAAKKGETSVVSVTGNGADALVKQIRQSGAESAQLDFSVSEAEDPFAVELPVRVLRAFADEGFHTLTLRFPAGEVSLNGETLKQLAQQGKDKARFQLSEDAESSFALTARLDGKDLENVPGGLKVRGELTAVGEPKGMVAFLADGETERMLRSSHYQDGHMVATLSGSSRILVRNGAGQFDDVSTGYWGAGDVAYVSARGLMNGTGKRKFGPETSLSRAMVVTILYRMAEEPTVEASRFSDVATGKYYSDAVAWAAAQGIAEGYKNAFRPNGDMTREELAVMLYRYAQTAGMDVSAQVDLAAYTDATSVSAWAKDAMEWMVGTGLLRGVKKDQLAPKDSVTRAQMAAIMTRYLLGLEN